MKTETKYFGEVEFEKEDILRFRKGLFGFEDEREFLVIPFSENGTLYSLQSVATPQLSFVLMHPFSLDPGYAPVLQEEELAELKVEKSEDLFYYTMCAMKDPISESTVNLKCPIAINEGTRQAVQVILENGPYFMRHRLADFTEEKGDAPC